LSEVSALDRRWLDSAARLARTAQGTTGEHPAAAALIIDESLQLVFGRGIAGRGIPVPETHAIAEARTSARDRTLYVTLEPSNVWGRTPPSTDGIIQAGLARVVIGATSRERGGEGIARLRGAGIDVVLADHAPSRDLLEAREHRLRTRRPYVTAKLVVSKDGMVGLPDRPNAGLGGPETQRWVQMARAVSDAVMIGARAAEIDDPRLTVNLKGLEARSHLRIVASGTRPLNTELNLIAGVSGYPTAILAVTDRSFETPEAVDVIHVDGRNGRPDLRKALLALAGRGISNLLVEGGARLVEAFIANELADRFHLVTTGETIGKRGIPATMLGGLDGRLRAAGFAETDQRPLGADRLRSFEREV
jgi:diaminohydroxyphosphoribosylaminopyrimidine deaminase/5-amino-6-(5-phosphoribosylamino)uracil reductase